MKIYLPNPSEEYPVHTYQLENDEAGLIEVEIPHSLYRKIRSAFEKYNEAQGILIDLRKKAIDPHQDHAASPNTQPPHTNIGQ